MTSEGSPLEILLWRILNDRKIFRYRPECNCIVGPSEMKDFRRWLSSDDLDRATRFLGNKIQGLEKKICGLQRQDEKRYEPALQFARKLKAGLSKYHL